MSRKQYPGTYEDIISVENLLEAWQEFLHGKRKKKDVQEFQYRLMDNILELHRELATGTYRHGGYHAFKVSDPKPRDIHKASVRDRLLHHALHRKLYPFFDRAFVADSYSCRAGKGTHKALNRFRSFAFKVSKNRTRTCWVLKCDIRKFFANIDHEILLHILRAYIPDQKIMALLEEIILSFPDITKTDTPIISRMLECPKGLPLGNLTSQLLVNIYMNEFDQYIKRSIKAKYYIRFADDFVVLHQDRQHIVRIYLLMAIFLERHLSLCLHPNKVSIATLDSGVDFLGWVHFSNHRVLRTSTKRRAIRGCLSQEKDSPRVNSYLGLMKHGNAFKIAQKLMVYHHINRRSV